MFIKVMTTLALLVGGNAAHALYGARPATKAYSRAVVSIHLADPENASEGAFCAGVLVSPTKVLTAGHCIDVMGLEIYDFSSKFIYEPELLRVNIQGRKVRVKSVRLADSYYSSAGLEGEDVAFLELSEKSDVTPIPLAAKSSIHAGQKAIVVAHGLEASTVIKSVSNYYDHFVMKVEGKSSGVCAGDSGGALLIEKNGRVELAGIVLVASEGCTRMDYSADYPFSMRK